MEIPEETQRLDQDQLAAKAQIGKGLWAKRKLTWVALLAVGIAVVVIVFVMMRPESRNQFGPGGSDVRGLSGRAKTDFSPGAEVRLFIPRSGSIMVAADETALNELINAISGRGDEVQNLSEAGRIFTVANDTRARIIETRFPKIKVRIIEGDKIMSEGWVPETWVR